MYILLTVFSYMQRARKIENPALGKRVVWTFTSYDNTNANLIEKLLHPEEFSTSYNMKDGCQPEGLDYPGKLILKIRKSGFPGLYF